MNDLKSRHPHFRGNWEDLRQFELLSGSPIRTQAREDALRCWEQYAIKRRLAAQSDTRKKGARMRALISRTIDLSGANLDEICIGYPDLRGVILDDCSLRGAWLKGANLENASLRRVNFTAIPSSGRGAARLLYAFMRGADLTEANCQGVDLSFASLNDATISRANLSDANLSHVSLVRASVDGAILVNTRVYGIAAWELKGSPAVQQDLIITQDNLGDKGYYYVLQESERARVGVALSGTDPDVPPDISVSSAVRVDNLELAQFVNLLMHNEKIRDVIETIGQKGVLILGRFTKERKSVLESMRKKLRELGYVPMIFDFERPAQRDFTETIRTLVGLSRFVIADITNPRSSPLELQATMPEYMIPFVPIIEATEEPFSMFRDLANKYSDWVLDVLQYDSSENLASVLESAVVKPALERSGQLLLKKTESIRIRHVKDYLTQ